MQRLLKFLFPLRDTMYTICLLLFLGQQLGNAQPLFSPVDPMLSGVYFNNKLIETPALNIITYEYFYNGGGVGIADFNRDGLQDIIFSANMLPNKMYVNKGNWQFDDVTTTAGVGGRPGWKTGISIVDVNADGWPDIYQCYSGDVDSTYRCNQLFINNQNGTFTDQATQWGIADAGYTTQAVFFDYDRDGDVDLFVLNHNIKNLRNFDAAYVKKMVDPFAGDHLYRNEGKKFVEVTQQAGIIANPLGYGLGVAVSDVNNDGWPDVYVSNDYVEEDYLYINQQDGTFSESLQQHLGHISNFSMGSDIADINNDGYQDIFTLDMLPADNKRQKLLYAPDNYETYNSTLNNGFYHQLMRNMLHLNNGNNTFSEIGQLSGVSNTDWSWSALFADFTNSGRKDLLVTNGYGRDMINRDFMKFYANERLKHLRGETDSRMFKMLQGIKTTPLTNYLFQNMDGIHFTDQSANWGFTKPTLSHGAAYADLDNDGDLDIVINNMNDTAGIFRNNTIENNPSSNWMQIRLLGNFLNKDAIGAKVTVYSRQLIQVQEMFPTRGFQSSMLAPLHFGLPTTKPDSIKVRWPNGVSQTIYSASIHAKVLTIQQENNNKHEAIAKVEIPIFQTAANAIPFRHIEKPFNDFKIQPLLPNMISYSGPKMAKADVNKDGLDDLFIGGSAGQPGRLMLQKNGEMIPQNQPAFVADAAFEDTDAEWLDADNDGDLDLVVASGGFRFPVGDSLYAPRLYININGVFQKSSKAWPSLLQSHSCVRVADVNADGWMDVFLGARVIAGSYPLAPWSHLLLNDKKGGFVLADSLNAGMVTDARWADINNDGKQELIVCGEWTKVQVFNFQVDKWTNLTEHLIPNSEAGWWNCLEVADVDGDGDLDIIAGNWGLNSQMKPTKAAPVTLFYQDFDDNGNIDPIVCYFIGSKSYPMASRDELTDQMVSLRQRFPTYDAYSEATIEDILTTEQRSKANILAATNFKSCWFENKEGIFLVHDLPDAAQFGPVYAIAVADFDGDGNKDVLLGGNVTQTRIKIGKIDANFGTLLLGNGKGGFETVPSLKSGLSIKGCIRQLQTISIGGQTMVIAGINNGLPIPITYSSKTTGN